jgi:hypothetical protein
MIFKNALNPDGLRRGRSIISIPPILVVDAGKHHYFGILLLNRFSSTEATEEPAEEFGGETEVGGYLER